MRILLSHPRVELAAVTSRQYAGQSLGQVFRKFTNHPQAGNLKFSEPDPAALTHETELIVGPAARALADVTRTRNADEIVVGARGLGRVRELLGRVSHELLNIADRPVVVMPRAAVKR